MLLLANVLSKQASAAKSSASKMEFIGIT